MRLLALGRRVFTRHRSPSTVDIHPPDLNHLHLLVGWPHPVAHRYPGGGPSGCREANILDPHRLAPTDEIRRLHQTRRVIWCAKPGCFPGGRCRICRVPSGGHDECADCLAASIDVDTAHRRAA